MFERVFFLHEALPVVVFEIDFTAFLRQGFAHKIVKKYIYLFTLFTLSMVYKKQHWKIRNH